MNRGKSSANPAELSQLNLNSGGIDVGATSHFVAVPADRAEPPVREFEAFTADLYRLADWLAQCGVETVVMETTGELPLHCRPETKAGGVATANYPRHSSHGPGNQKGGAEPQTAGKTAAGQRARPVHQMPSRTRQTKQGPLRAVLQKEPRIHSQGKAEAKPDKSVGE